MKIKEEDLRRELEVTLSRKDSQPRCSSRLGMRLNRFKQLLRRARIHGIDAVLHSNMAGSYTDEFKLIVVNSVINESLTLGDLRPKKVTHLQLLPRRLQEGAKNEASYTGRAAESSS